MLKAYSLTIIVYLPSWWLECPSRARLSSFGQWCRGPREEVWQVHSQQAACQMERYANPRPSSSPDEHKALGWETFKGLVKEKNNKDEKDEKPFTHPDASTSYPPGCIRNWRHGPRKGLEHWRLSWLVMSSWQIWGKLICKWKFTCNYK